MGAVLALVAAAGALGVARFLRGAVCPEIRTVDAWHRRQRALARACTSARHLSAGNPRSR